MVRGVDGFRNAWRAELAKVTTVRGLVTGAVLATAAAPFTTLLVVATGGVGDHDTLTSAAAAGSVAGLLGFGSWGALVASSEYAVQTVPVSMTLVPRRGILAAAKAATVAAIAGGGAALAAVTSLGVVAAVTPHGGQELGQPLALLAYVVAAIAVAIVGLAAGVLTRSPTGSVSAVVVAVLFPKAAAGLLGALQPWVVGASPGTVITQAVGGTRLPVSQMFPLGAAAATLAMVLVATVVAASAAVTFARRDG